MQLLRIKLENWRAVRSREITLGSGVNIVEGANEAGKSSFIEALNVIFRERDSTKKKEIKSITPKGNDVGSTVEVELQTGEYHFIYTKTYNKRAATSLSVLKPALAQYTGMQAHDEALRILDETIDLTLWQAIQLEQGSEFSEINLRQSTGLAKALDSAAGGSGVGEDDSALLAQAKAEYLRYHTEKTGRETGELAEVRLKCDSLRSEIETASTAMQNMQMQVDRSAAIAEELQEHNRSLPELKAALEVLQKKQVELESLRERNRTVRAEFDAQSLRVDEAQRQLSDRYTVREQLALQQQTLQALTDKHKTLVEDASQLSQKHTELHQNLEQGRERKAGLQKLVAELEAAMKQQADVQELSALENRLKQYNQSQKLLDQSVHEYQQYQIDNNTLDELQALQKNVRELEVRLDAQQPELTVTALQDSIFNDKPVVKDTVEPMDTSVEFEFRIGSSATITFKPATNLAGLRDELQAVKSQLSDRMGQYAVRDIGEAVAANRRRNELHQQIKGLKQRRDDLLDQQVELVQQRVEALRASVLPAGSLDVQDDLPEQLVSKRTELDEIEREVNRHMADQSSLQAGKAGIDAQLELLQRQIVDQQQAVSQQQQQLAQQLAKRSDDALTEKLQREKLSCQRLKVKLQDAEGALSQSQGDEISQQVDNARHAVDRATAQFHEDEKELAAVTAQLDTLRAEGLHEKLEHLHAELNDAQERLQQLTRAAGAAKYLWESLRKHQRATQLSYVKPLSELVCGMGRIVFGNDFQVNLNESLGIESRTLHGLTVPFDDLSGGAREQLGILLRLAATQLVAGVPLILDDTLGHTDAARLQTIGALLSTAGRQSQIVVMTCYPQRYRHVGDALQHRLVAESPVAG